MGRSKAEQDLLDKELLLAGKHIKKIVAGGGKIKGVFYFTGNRSGDDAALIVNLMAKDKKGTNAESVGKKLRKTIPQAKYKRGTVEITDEKKLVFRLVKGNSSPAEMRKAFRTFAQKGGLGFIKKAIFAGEEVAEEDAKDQELSDEDLVINVVTDLGLSEKKVKKMRKRLEADPDLMAFFKDETAAAALEQQNEEMNASFLRADAEEEEWEDFMKAELSKLRNTISDLEEAVANGTAKRSKLERARAEFSKLNAQGAELFEPTVGSTVDRDTRILMAASNDDQANALNNQHRDISAEISAIYAEMKKLPEEAQKGFAEEKIQEVLRYNAALETQKGHFENL